jgi:hypothetical protein
MECHILTIVFMVIGGGDGLSAELPRATSRHAHQDWLTNSDYALPRISVRDDGEPAKPLESA